MIDAGQPAVAVAVPGVDAGAAEVVKSKGAPPTAAELELVASLEKLAQQEKWETIWESRGRVRASIKSPLAREQALSILISAICARNDNAQLSPTVADYKSVATGSQLRAVRQRCLKVYPGAESLGW